MIKEETAKIQQLAMKTVKGRMKIHAVVGQGDGHYATREILVLRSAVIWEGSLFWGVLGGRGG